MKIAIGNDHAAPELKLAVKAHLEEKGIEVVDMGCAPGEKCDYPDAAASLSAAPGWGCPTPPTR